MKGSRAIDDNGGDSLTPEGAGRRSSTRDKQAGSAGKMPAEQPGARADLADLVRQRSSEADGHAPLILVERVTHLDADIALITLNQPLRRNPLNWEVVHDLHSTVAELSVEGGPATIVITGAGNAFSSGGDLLAYTRLYQDREAFRQYMSDFEAMCALIETCRPLVIAMINGTCVAGGLELSLACDLITIADTATVGDGHLRYGQLPGGGGSQRLVRAIGVSRARQWLLTGQLYPAQEAVSVGLAILVAPERELRARTFDLAASIARFTPLGLRLMKQLIATAQESSMREGLTAEQRLVLEYATASHDATEGLRAFLERREPRYLGR